MQKQGTTDELTPKQTTDQLGTPPIIEGDIAASEVTGTEPPEPHISDYPTVPLVPPRREFHFNYWLLVAALLLVLLVGEHISPVLTYLQTTFFHRQATV